jgi:hypothetical protein
MLVYDYSVSSDRKSVNATYLRNITFLRNGRKSTLLRGLAATNGSHKVAFATALANPAIKPSNAIELVDICSPSPQASEELSPDWNFFSADVSNANAVAASPDGKWLCFSNQVSPLPNTASFLVLQSTCINVTANLHVADRGGGASCVWELRSGAGIGGPFHVV